jgi:IS5 family transposase
VCRFRHLLEAHDLGQQLFDEVQAWSLTAARKVLFIAEANRHDASPDDNRGLPSLFMTVMRTLSSSPTAARSGENVIRGSVAERRAASISSRSAGSQSDGAAA